MTMENYKLAWQNIVGHKNKIEHLKKMVAEQKFPHAIIFSGSEGIGKRKVAESCAAALLCSNSKDGEPCGVCENCRLVVGKSHPDFYVVEAAETKTTRIIKIGQIRELQTETSLRPIKAALRVVILDGAEFMNNPSANCLLKTLEEPPSQTIFILLTANRAGLLMTLRSRCVTLNFDNLTSEEIKFALLQREISPAEAEKLSIISGGSLGRALALAETGGYELRESALNFVERLCADEITNEDIFTKGIQISSWSRNQFSEFVIYIQKILHDIYFAGKGEVYNSDLTERLNKIKISERKIYSMIEIGVKIHKRIKSNANLRLLAESYLMLLKKNI